MRIALFLIALFAFASCTSIDKLEPAQTSTFLKFYNETNEMDSKDLIVLNDGYLILSIYNKSNTLLLKTDLLGNKLWAQSMDNFLGASLVEVSDGYILIGDSINIEEGFTYMRLIKTDFNGAITNTTQIGYGAQHGSAVTLTANNEVIALGYTSTGQINDSDDSTYVIANGYDINLTQTWDTVRTNPVLGVDIVPSNSVYESDNGYINWISYASKNEVITNLDFTSISPDGAPEGNLSLFNQYAVANFKGDFVKTPVGFTIVQTVIQNGFNNIGVASTINGVLTDDEFVIPLGFNSIASSITNSTNGLLVVATTDIHEEKARTDMDLLLLEIDINGQIKSNGINVSFGGNGDEIPSRVRNTKDGGYAILGTVINTKGAKQTFFLKTNKKGLLE